MTPSARETLKETLKRHGLRCTEQRRALLSALAAAKSHPTAEELYHLVRDHTRSLSLATVYSTLETFCRVGLARKLPGVGGSCRYDADTSPHMHLRLRDSGEVMDVPGELSDRFLRTIPADMLREIERRLGVRIEGLSIQLQARREPAEAQPGQEPVYNPGRLVRNGESTDGRERH